ncbi:uncharacterized protein LOC108632859 isoform X2 [Ceratina calcarata]|uniref:Uncharacterized protein LOC108632859 isoform X2 n=1 Tax=Ceratina calcarata TaxID=156304 RepID=A0AAJ7NFT2_9HYME|nr:uncharacterized protein LOC108632859 isoform X2 [Ceratina calcarata]
MDMWVYLPMVSLLVRAIVGNSEIDDTTVSSDIGSGNASDISPNDNHTAEPSIDVWKMSKRERNKRGVDPNVIDEVKSRNDLLNSDKIVFKEMTMGPWFPPTRREGFEQILQERTNPQRWWQDEKRNTGKPILSCECKLHVMYHHGFDSGGGKRGAVYTSDVGSKRTKINYNRDDQNKILNELNGIEGQDLSKMIWDKWGGKRADMSNRERVLLFLKNPDARVLNVIKGGLPKERAARIKDIILTMYGKHDFDNEASNDERVNEIDDWLTTPAKKEHEQYKKTKFNPWGGKRSVRSWNDYIECMLKTLNMDSHS